MEPQAIFTELKGRRPELAPLEEAFLAMVEMTRKSYAAGGKLLVCGNGGSASDAEHIVGELLKGFRSKRTVPAPFAKKLTEWFPVEGPAILAKLEWPLPAIALTSHPAFATAFQNDNDGLYTFAQQLLGLGREGDTLLAISTSGNSRNVVAAVQVAKAMGLGTIALTGGTGGKLADLCDVVVKAPADKVHLIQECHLPLYHAFCFALEEIFFPGQMKPGC